VAKGKKPAPASRAPKPRTAGAAAASSVFRPDARAAQIFRSKHGTAFNPNSSLDRVKMEELRRRLLSRNQIVRLRTE